MKSRDKKRKKSFTRINPDLAAINLFAEVGLLKKIKRSGWWVAGIKDPESVAEHCLRTAIMGYYVAHLEKVDPYKVVLMTLFNDMHESRINDLHKMGHYYIDFKDAEKRVFKDQIENLVPSVRREMSVFRQEYDNQKTRESIVARDVDILECLLQAKEYYEEGHTKAKTFFAIAPEYLKTKTARRFWTKIKNWDSSRWWKHVVRFER